MLTQNNIRAVLNGHPLVPVVTFHKGDDSVGVAQFLLQKGVKCIEITLRTDEGWEAIQKIKKALGSEMLVGAGTVINTKQINQLKELEIDFIVSPGATKTLLESMEASTIPYLPGVATPSEVMQAMEWGLDTLKFFPANLYGGIKALKNFGQLFPQTKFCPTGGIDSSTYPNYLELNNVFAVGGSWLLSDFNHNQL